MTKFDEFGLPEPTKYPQMPKVIKMNKRIDELSQEAENYADEYWLAGDRSWLATYTEKFAELIVKECADISDASFHDGSAGYLAILNHFGIK